MKYMKNLHIFKGDYLNPYHLLNAGLNKASFILFLTENVDSCTKEDMNKLLAFKSFDFFFDVPFILELWSHFSIRLLGYNPLDRNSNIIINEFLHPQFMAGNLLYLNHLDKIIAKSHTDENEYEVFLRLISLGFESASNSFGFKPKLGKERKEGFPVIVTFELPDFYYNKDYHQLFSDLLALDEPAIPLGIYVEDPLQYINLRSEGKVQLDKNKMVLMLSHKN